MRYAVKILTHSSQQKMSSSGKNNSSYTNQASTLQNTYIMNVVSKTATKRLSRFDLQPVTPNELGALSMIYKEGEFQFLRTTTTR